jgi:hypothetical protein
MGRWLKKIKNKQYGQAMAEFALTIPVFLLLVFGIIELSRFFLVYSSVYTASREASRFATSVGEGGTRNYLNCNAIADRAVFHGAFGGVQMNDVTIYYESSPGIIIASCPNTNLGSLPVKGNCHDGSINCEEKPPAAFTPVLGNRILVDIETEFSSLLGIVPDLQIHANNGRTIMMAVTIDKSPEPFDLCEEKVRIDSLPSQGSESNILNFGIDNSSKTTFYTIYEINNITWKGDAKLSAILWEENEIWKSDGEGKSSGLSIPGGENFWVLNNRNISPESTSEKLEFVFIHADLGVDEDGKPIPIPFPITPLGSELDFDLVMQHRNLPTDFCNPVIQK